GIWLFAVSRHPAKPKIISTPISFHFTPPSGWGEVKPTPKGAMATYAGPSTESDDTGYLKPFIVAQSSVLQSKKSQNMTAKQLTDAYVTQLSGSYNSYQQLSSTPEMLDRQPATLIKFTSVQGQTAVTVDSLFFVKNKVMYTVNGESLSTTWGQHEAE